MTDKFVASNGVVLEIGPAGHLKLPSVSLGFGQTTQQALREFFQHKHDEELGRWRSTAQPNMVAYPHVLSSKHVRFVDESTGESEIYSRKQAGTFGANPFSVVSEEYFAAHPEPKPWHDAKPGEVWVFKGKLDEPSPFVRAEEGPGWYNRTRTLVADTPEYDGRPYGYSHDPNFEPYRIWPQD